MNFHNASFKAAYGTSEQLPASTGPEVSFAGRSNVGKSSLLNKLMYRKGLAKVSSTPGKTATINFYDVDGHDLVAFETLTTKETETDRETGEKTTVDKTVAEHKDIDDANQTVTVTSDKSSMAQTGRNILIGAAIAAAVAAGAGGTYIYRKRHQIDDADDMME